MEKRQHVTRNAVIKAPTCIELSSALVRLRRGIRQAGAAKTKPAEAIVVPPPTPSAEPPPIPARGLPQRVEQKVGTLAKPCLGEGDSRMMEVKYTGKTTDEGPKFSVTNKSNSQLLFASVAAYFYDKASKLLGGVPQQIKDKQAKKDSDKFDKLRTQREKRLRVTANNEVVNPD